MNEELNANSSQVQQNIGVFLGTIIKVSDFGKEFRTRMFSIINHQ